MPSTNFISEIQRLYPPEIVKILVGSLSLDPLVWRSLHQNHFWEKTARVGLFHSQDWSPGNLALSELETEFNAEHLGADPMLVLPRDIRQKALNIYEEILKEPRAPKNLSEAGLLALALRERRRVTQTWDGIIDEICIYNTRGEKISYFNIWQTPIACLYSLIPDAEQLLKYIVGGGQWNPYYALASHAVMSNPLSEEKRISHFTTILTNLVPSEQVEWLRRLSLQGFTEIVKSISSEILKLKENPEELIGSEWLPERIIQSALEHYNGSGLWFLAGDEQRSDQNLNISRSRMEAYKGIIHLKQIEIASHQNDPGKLKDLINQVGGLNLSEDLRNELAVEVGSTVSDSIMELQPSGEVEGFLSSLITCMKALESGDEDQLKQVVGKLIEELKRITDNPCDGFPFRVISSWDPGQLIEKLECHHLEEEASQIGMGFLILHPCDSGLMDKLSVIFEKINNLDLAIEHARISLVLNPSNTDKHRRMASLWEQTEKWLAAFDEWSRVVQLCDLPTMNDWLGYARTADHSNQYHHVIEACNRILENRPEDIEASQLISKAYYNVGRYDDVIAQLNHPVLLASISDDTWLFLSLAYAQKGDSGKKLETLKLGVSTIPDSPDLNLALAGALQEDGLFEESLPFLQKVVVLKPTSLENIMKLGETLNSLGRFEEACPLYEQAFIQWPEDKNLAYAYGLCLVAVEQDDKAIPIIEVAVKGTDVKFEWLLSYIRILMGKESAVFQNKNNELETKLGKAAEAINRGLMINPEAPELLLYKADILTNQENFQPANEIYKILLEKKNKDFPEWGWRVKSGLGFSSLKIGNLDTALAATQEAVRDNPYHLKTVQLLTDVYFQANLNKEAFEAASHTLEIAPDDIENLIWFSDKAILLGNKPAALRILQKVAGLEPENLEVWMSLARLQFDLGNIEELKQIIKTIISLSNVDIGHLRRAASFLLLISEEISALSCLEKAMELSSNPPAILFFEIVCLNLWVGNPEIALQTLQKAIGLYPEYVNLLIFEADLLTLLQRPQMALASLEQAVQLYQKLGVVSSGFAIDETIVKTLLPENWIKSLDKLSSIYMRYGLILRENGDHPLAAQQLFKALEICPEDLSLRYATADLCAAMLRYDEAEKIATLPASKMINFEATSDIEKETISGLLLINLLCLNAEIDLNRGEENWASKFVQMVLVKETENARIIALKARLFSRKGYLDEARAWFQSSKDLGKRVNERKQDRWPCLPPEDVKPSSIEVWQIEAAIDAQLWDQAIELCDGLIKERPREPLAHLIYAKLFVNRAEQEKFCVELACVNHRPGKKSLDIGSYEKFKQEISATANLASSEEIERWKARGELIFNPTDKNIQMLKEVATSPDDHAAILSAIRQSGSEIGEPQNINVGLLNPSYLIQLAYYYLKHDAVEGFNIARRIVDSQPVNPLVHVILTKLAQANESLESAYQYLKAALNIWEDEPRWHAEAAMLAYTLGNEVDAVHHWEKALALEPEEAEYAIQLGQVYLTRGKYREAIDKLNRAISCKPEDWNLWFMLATAYLKAGQLKEALDSSERSLKLNPSSARILKQCGEIALGLGDKPKAFEYARGAVRIEPKNVEALVLLSTVLERQGKPQDALAVLEHSINLIGKDHKLLMERARLVMETSGPRSALPFWEALSESDPENIEVLKMLSKAQIADGNLEKAENTLHQALRLESNQPDIYLVMGKLQRKLGNLDKAIFYFNETINLETSNVEAYIELALSYQERREYLQALNFYQQAIKISPNDDRPYYQAALVMREIKDYVGAEAMLRRAAKLSPDDLSIRRQLSAVIALNLVHNAREVTPFYEKR